MDTREVSMGGGAMVTFFVGAETERYREFRQSR